MIDLHTHVLPDLDDGPPNTAGALAMARVAVAAGTTTLVATPHIDDQYGLGPAQVHVAVESLNVALARHDIPLRVLAGGEVSTFRLPEMESGELEALALGAGAHVLLEAPLSPTVPFFEEAFDRIRSAGLSVLIAHPERSPLIQRDRALLARLVDRGGLTQITSGSLTGQFGTTVREFTVQLLREGLVHNIASDAHDAERRHPDMRAALEALAADGYGALSDWLVDGVPDAIVHGTPLPARPELPRRRRLWPFRRAS